MFGYFALGVLLGLLVGAVIAAILVLAVIKCCDKGKVAPYYTVRPGTRDYVRNDNDNDNDNQSRSKTMRTQTE